MALVHYEVAGDVGTITLDSPANRNALSRQLVTELFGHLETSMADESRVVVLRSSERVFCSGADLSEAATTPLEEGLQAIADLQRMILAHPKPVVIRLDGPVRAGGLGLVASADIVICNHEVTFAFTESRLGVAPSIISLTVLPRMTSRGAAETFLTGRKFSAAEAAAMGLITRAVDDVDAEMSATIAELLKAHPQGLRETKAVLNRQIIAGLDAGRDEMAALSGRLFATDEARDAMLAFLSMK